MFAAAFLGGVLVGGIGFIGGFFGPILLDPGANQGPLLGIFTGPLGFVAGAIGGVGLPAPPRPDQSARIIAAADGGRLR